MKNIINVIILVILFTNCLCAQDEYSVPGEIKNVIREGSIGASPDVSAFQKVSLYDVNLYTGKANIAIPIYTIKSGDITIPISIDYNSGGVKVDDYATSVGLNWSLNAGGNIIRIVKDYPDNDMSFGLFSEYDWDLGVILKPVVTASGYNRKNGTPNTDHLDWGPTNRYAVYSENVNVNDLVNTPPPNYVRTYGQEDDASPDLFIVNAPSLSSKFTCVNLSNNEILPNNPATFTTSFLNNPGYKMNRIMVDVRASNGYGFFSPETPMPEKSHYFRTSKDIKDFYEFSIINDKGLIYNFGEVEISESFYSQENFNNPNLGWGWDTALNAIRATVMNNYSKQIHTWNLEMIQDTNGNRIFFEYETYGNNFNDVKNVIKTEITVNTPPQNLSETEWCRLNYLSESAYNTLHPGGRGQLYSKNPQKKRLKKIIFNEGEVNFIYNLNREDHLGEKALTQIVIKNLKGHIVESYGFNYAYFNSKENCIEPECKRLKLLTLDKKNNFTTESLTHQFEYYNANKLPKRGSLEQDYLGYYNNNGLYGITSNVSAAYTPKLYFYPNNGVNSLLPFKLINNPNYVYLNGQIDLNPNNNSLIGLLKTISYPTGSKLELEYENNSFKYLNHTYTSGGARLKAQSIYDRGILKKNLNYEYKEIDESTSGYMNNFPLYGYVDRYKITPFVPYSFLIYDKPKNNIELTNGSYVGYSRVIERETNNGRIEYNFTSPKEILNIPEQRTPTYSEYSNNVTPYNSSCLNLLIQNSAFPSTIFLDNDYMRGKLINKFVYNNTNINPIYKEEFKYLQRDLSELILKKIINVEDYLDNVYIANYTLKLESKLKVAQYLNTQIKKTSIFNNQPIETITDFEYGAMLPFIKKITSNANNSILTTHRYYSNDPEVSQNLFVDLLNFGNKSSEVIKEEVKRDNELLSTTQKNYFEFNKYTDFSIIAPKSISSSKGINPLKEDQIVTKRDSRGNIIEYHNQAGIYTAIIYGYNKSLPIAKIENATYSQVVNFESNLQNLSNVGSEQNLIVALNNLRIVLPNMMITTNTYIPLIGITSMTDSKGITTTYHYDKYNRLEFVKDFEGKILNENKYHYRTEN